MVNEVKQSHVGASACESRAARRSRVSEGVRVNEPRKARLQQYSAVRVKPLPMLVLVNHLSSRSHKQTHTYTSQDASRHAGVLVYANVFYRKLDGDTFGSVRSA